jgi:negative regulator of replication initiation
MGMDYRVTPSTNELADSGQDSRGQSAPSPSTALRLGPAVPSRGAWWLLELSLLQLDIVIIVICHFVMQAETLIKNIMRRASKASAEHDIEELDRMTRYAKRVQVIAEQQKQFSTELEKIAEAVVDDSLDAELVGASAGIRRKGIRVSIDWRSVSQSRDLTRIEQAKGSKALVGFLSEIYSVMGEEALEKLTALRISRGPLVSVDPKRDFINRGDGSVYAHHPIPGTKYFVITHSGTTEKMEAMRAAARLIGLKNAVSIERI